MATAHSLLFGTRRDGLPYLAAKPKQLRPGPAVKLLMTNNNKCAVLYRMVLPTHECPFGVRAKQMLEDAGFEIEEHILGSREDVDAFMESEGVERTPQVFIGGERIGGSDELDEYLQGAEA